MNGIQKYKSFQKIMRNIYLHYKYGAFKILILPLIEYRFYKNTSNQNLNELAQGYIGAEWNFSKHALYIILIYFQF